MNSPRSNVPVRLMDSIDKRLAMLTPSEGEEVAANLSGSA